MPNTALIARLESNRENEHAAMSSILDTVKANNRTALSSGEQAKFDEHGKVVKEISARLVELREEDALDAESAATIRQYGIGASMSRRAGGFTAAGKDTVYTEGSGHSYFRDLVSSVLPGSPEGYSAIQRLHQHAEMLDRVGNNLPEMFRAGPGKRAAGSTMGQEQRVTPSRVDGNGGYFVPPLWQVEKWIPYLRAGRSVADRFDQNDLPPGTDSINIPRLKLGTKTGPQADNGAVTSQDIQDDFVSGPVRTIAGQEDIPMQLLEQSPVAFDKIIGKDLLSDYNQQLDIQCITGTGTGLQVKGLNNITGINNITFTSGSPTLQLLYPILGQAASQVARQRFSNIDTFALTPQRWWWIVSALDTAGRPLLTPEAGGNPQNNIAVFDANASEGIAGTIMGIPVVVDANIPSNVSSNQDTIWAARMSEAYLFEGAVRVRALMEVLSGTLQVRVQMYNYVATIPDRLPVSFSAINGTGLLSPSGY
jgi:HK97 family phage major capsid protein